MPRIRTLKPEHKTHRKVGPLSDRAYRLWVGMLTEADDDGRLVADLGQLRALIFPYQSLALSKLEQALTDLTTAGLIQRYECQGNHYVCFPSWADHQKRDAYHYTPSKLPIPPILTQQSLNGDSAESPGSLGGDDTTGKGREGKGTGTPPLTPPGGESLESLAGDSLGFGRFWAQYPKKVGKGAARAAWIKTKAEPIAEAIVAAVCRQASYLEREGGRFIPLPATWLMQRRWEDDPPADALHAKTKANTAGVAEWLRQQQEAP